MALFTRREDRKMADSTLTGVMMALGGLGTRFMNKIANDPGGYIEPYQAYANMDGRAIRIEFIPQGGNVTADVTVYISGVNETVCALLQNRLATELAATKYALMGRIHREYTGDERFELVFRPDAFGVPYPTHPMVYS